METVFIVGFVLFLIFFIWAGISKARDDEKAKRAQ